MGERGLMRPRAEPKRKAEIGALIKARDVNTGEAAPVVAYFCKNCGTVYSNKGGVGKYNAERCSVKRPWKGDPSKFCSEWACEQCGEPSSPYQWLCSKCLNKRRWSREKEKIAKAELAEDYPDDQGVFWEGNYYGCIEDVIDYCEGEGIDIPDRVWATEPVPFVLDMDGILDSAFENWAEGCGDIEPSFRGRAGLRAAFKAFNEANSSHLVLYAEVNKAVDMSEHKPIALDDDDSKE